MKDKVQKEVRQSIGPQFNNWGNDCLLLNLKKENTKKPFQRTLHCVNSVVVEENTSRPSEAFE